MANNTVIICKGCGKEITRIIQDPIKPKVYSYNELYEYANLTKVKSLKKNYFFICHDCTLQPTRETYSIENIKTVGTPKAHGFTFSVELETNSLVKDSLFLYEHYFFPSYDCTVKTEWKSPIYYGLSPIPKLLTSIYKNNLSYGSNCGTHVNIGNYLYDEKFWDICKLSYKSLFKRAYNHVRNHADYEILFGRSMTDYSGLFQNWDRCGSHDNWITIRSNYIEFRQAKFTSDEQFMLLLKTLRDFIIVTYEGYIKKDSFEIISDRQIKVLQDGLKKAIEIDKKINPLKNIDEIQRDSLFDGLILDNINIE